MTPSLVKEEAPIPPPAYYRAQAKLGPARPFDALALVKSLHLLALCQMYVRLAQWRCSPPLPAGPGGAPRISYEESLLLIALLRALWRKTVPGYARLAACLARGFLWRATCPWTSRDIRACRVPPNNGSEGLVQGHRCRKPSLSSPCSQPSAHD